MSGEKFEHFLSKLALYSNQLQGRTVSLVQEKVRVSIGAREQSPLRVILCGMGESLMHKSCYEWIARMRNEIGCRVSLVTNGVLLKEKNVEKLKQADITVVLVSVPGLDKESYSKYMRLDWDLVLKNIETAHKIMPGRIQINATIPDDATYGSEEIINFWGEKGIPIAGISHCHNRGGFLSDSALTGRFGNSNNKFCGILARHNFIAWDGRILSCCHDLHAENVMGDVSNDDFMEIALKKTRTFQLGAPYRICRSCNDIERLQAGQILKTKRSSLPIVTDLLGV